MDNQQITCVCSMLFMFVTQVSDVKKFLLEKILADESLFLAHQHDTQRLIVSKYLDLRIRITCQCLSAELTSNSSTRGSKSMTMRELAAKVR